MQEFTLIKAYTLDEVSQFLSEHHGHVCILAGGTDLLVQLHEKSHRWDQLEVVIDLKPLKDELSQIEEGSDYLRIGSLCTHTQIERSALVRKHIPFLSEACSLIGSPQIRNMGTIGGSICNASPASDPLPPLLAAEAQIVIHGPEHERVLCLADFIDSKGQPDLQQGEFVSAFIVRKLKAHERSIFLKLGRRKALAISRLSVASIIEQDASGKISQAFIVPGCVGKHIKRYTQAEQFLIGKVPSVDIIKQTASILSEQMIDENGRRWSSAYKEPVLSSLLERALTTICVGVEGENGQ